MAQRSLPCNASGWRKRHLEGADDRSVTKRINLACLMHRISRTGRVVLEQEKDDQLDHFRRP
jgi:hypothetical protein